MNVPLVLLFVSGVLSAYDPTRVSPCLRYSFAPINTQLLVNYLTTNYTTPDPNSAVPIDTQIRNIALNLVQSQAPGTEAEAALFFAQPMTTGRVFFRVRNCNVPEFALDPICSDTITPSGARLVEVQCPSCYGDDQVRIFLYVVNDNNPVLSFVKQTDSIYPSLYDDAQFWFIYGSNLNTGFLTPVNSGIPEIAKPLNLTTVFVRPAVKRSPYPGGVSPLVAAVGAIGSQIEPCNPPLDCVVGSWTAWSTCSANCDGGIQTRSRQPIVLNQFGGTECPAFGDQKPCNLKECTKALSGKGTTGVVIACIGAILLAGLVYFICAKRSPFFDGSTVKPHRRPRKQVVDDEDRIVRHEVNKSTQPEQQPVSPLPVPPATGRGTTNEDDEDARPVQKVHIWV